jgi:hypothetical protein
MTSTTVQDKAQSIANLIDGNVIDDSSRVAVCVKGTVEGFPATMEAIYPRWPFGTIYTIETNANFDPNGTVPQATLAMTIYPKVGRGIASFFTRLFLFENTGLPVGDKRLERVLNFSYDDRGHAERFVHYPGVSEILLNLESISKFSELILRFGVGIYLAQSASFNSLELDVARNTFKNLGALGKIMNEAF